MDLVNELIPDTWVAPLYIGVDPGTKGALAVVDGDGNGILSLRFSETTESDKVRAVNQLDKLGVHSAILEKVSSRPGQGVVSTFKFGDSYGFIRAAILSAKIKLVLVTPQAWQKALSIKKRDKNTESKTDFKRRLKGEAQRRFPDQYIVNENCDAYLIAEYCRLENRLPF